MMTRLQEHGSSISRDWIALYERTAALEWSFVISIKSEREKKKKKTEKK